MEVKILDVDEIMDVTPTGKTTRAYRVSAEVDGRATFTVDIPEGDFKPERVNQILQEKGATFAAVLGESA